MRLIHILSCHLLMWMTTIINEVGFASGTADYPQSDGRQYSDVSSRTSTITMDQKSKLKNSIKELILKDVHRDKYEMSRALEGGDWNFINEFLESVEIVIPVDETIDVAGVNFVLETIVCDSFAVDDIVADGDGFSTSYNLSFLVTGIALSCSFNYSYQGGFLVGSGSGSIDLNISPDTSIQTALIFSGQDLDSNVPSEVFFSCSTSLDIESINFGIRILDFFVSPLLPPILEPILEPAICQPLEDLDTMLSDAIMEIKDIVDEFNGPLTPELTDNLYPERMLNASSDSNFLDLMNLDPILEFITTPIDNFLKALVDDFIFGGEGTLCIPLMIPLEEGIDLVEVRLVDFTNFTVDLLSIIGNYTFETTLEIGHVGLEVDLEVTSNNITDSVVVKTAMDDLVFDFAMLVVVEKILDIRTLFTPFENVLNCISNSLFALEVAGLSLTSGSLDSLAISGFSLEGPQQVINEISEAIFFMYDALVTNALPYFFESTVRGAINDEIMMSVYKTCLEELSGRALYVPIDSACWKIELFYGGSIGVNYTDSDCSSETHGLPPQQSLAIFDYATENKAYFSEGALNWTGEIAFIEDPSVSELQVEADFFNDTQVFDIALTFPTCTAPCS